MFGTHTSFIEDPFGLNKLMNGLTGEGFSFITQKGESMKEFVFTIHICQTQTRVNRSCRADL